MSREAEDRNTGRGLQKLIKRYVVRAEHLQYDEEFNSVIEWLRNAWNGHFPEYFIDTRDATAVSEIPRLPRQLWDDLLADFKHYSPEGVITRSLYAFWFWATLLDSADDLFWPSEYFERPMKHGGRVTAEFVAASILHGPKTIPEELSTYFPSKLETIWLMWEESVRLDQAVSAPYHPDMNDEDLRSVIIFNDAVRQERYHQTTAGKIDQLRSIGVSDNAIAKALGLPRQSVNNHPRLD